MNLSAQRKAQEIIGKALELGVDERREFLTRECGGDALLRAEVEKLLAALEEAEAKGFLSDSDPLIGTSIGPYRIQRCLGVGGMGAVYLAEQVRPIQRMVALKIIKFGMDTRQVIARFEAEREALSLMNHPNVARVLDAGATDAGRPYFVMEYVEGTPITSYCDEHRLSTGERLKLVIDVCAAVQHAHQKGIIHRDIKPSNVLITEVDGKPVPKVIDFGIAKATQPRCTERTLFTEQGQLIGTPGYMSPEQAEMTALDIDTRTDVYSLGVLLYELLVGALPFDTEQLLRAGFGEMQRIIREVEPPKPSTRLSSMSEPPDTPSLVASTVRADAGTTTPIENREISSKPDSARSKDRGSLAQIAHSRHTEPKALIRQIRGDLDWIVMKCLEKDRTRRYDTASGLALEISRYLNNEPVLAGPPSAAYRVRKFVRRNKGQVFAAAAIMIVLLAGLAGTSFGLVQARRERAKAEQARDAESSQRKIAEGEKNKALVARDEAEAVTSFLSETLASVSPEELGKDVTVREVLDKAAETIGEEFKDSPLIEARLRKIIGWTYYSLGLYPNAEMHAAESAGIYRRTSGEQDPATLTAINDLSVIIGARGDFDRGEAQLRATLAVQRRVLGDEHPTTLLSMHNLAGSLNDQGRYAEAEELQRKTLGIRRRLRGSEHPETLASMNNLANSLHSQGRYAEAEGLFRETLEIRRRVLGDAHPGTLASMSNLATSLNDQGRFAEAEERYRKTLEIRRRILGEEHLDTLTSTSNLAISLNDQGRYAEADQLFRKTLEIRRRILSDEHPQTLASMNNLAICLRDQGRYSDADELHRKTLETQRRVLGDEHPDTLTSIRNLAISLNVQGRYAEAEGLFRETLETQRRVLGDEHPDTLVSMNNLATSINCQGGYAEAEELYRKTLEVQRRVLGDEHLSTLACMNNLVNSLNDQGRYGEADDLHRKALAIQRRVLGDEHPDTLMSKNNLANSLHGQGRYAEAEELFRKTWETQRRVLGAEHPGTLSSMNNLANSLHDQGRYAESEELYRQTLEIQRRVLGAEHPKIADTLMGLAEVLEKIQRDAEAQPLCREVESILAASLPEEHRSRRNNANLLGGILAGLGLFAQAEPLLIESYEALESDAGLTPRERKTMLGRFVRLYESWDAAEPGKGYAEKAAEWRAKLDQLNMPQEPQSSTP